jgi:acyl-[acyl-carrier-protein]-phospholipid O-acyltransferase / long-chain-fatty-acid--[acyl-carrier-protein] ligase
VIPSSDQTDEVFGIHNGYLSSVDAPESRLCSAHEGQHPFRSNEPPRVHHAHRGRGFRHTQAITCLAIFAISIAIGSRLAAWLAGGHIVLLPTVIGAVLLGAFAIDLGASTLGAPPIPGLDGYLAAFTNGRGIRLALDLAGLAIAGGLLVVPAFAAVQAWAGADRRARVVAAVNVLSSASIVGSTVIVAMLQTAGMTPSQLFLLLGAASLVVAIAVGRTMPASAVSDALSII